MRYVGTVLGKELREMSKRKRTYALRLAIPAVVLCVFFPMFFTYANDRYHSIQNLSEFGTVSFITIAYIMLGVGFFLTPSYCAPLITSEREQQTLEIIMSTPIRHYEIVLGKIASRVLLLMVMMLSCTPVLFVSLMFGGVSISQIILTFCILTSNIFICAGVSIVISAYAKRSVTAVARTYSLLIFVGIAVLFLMPFMFRFFIYYPAAGAHSLYEKVISFIFVSMNPYVAMMAIVEPLGLFSFSSSHIYYALLANAGFFALCIFFSSVILRKTAYREKKTSIFRLFLSGQKRRGSGKFRTSSIRIGTFWQNPVYWKECIESYLSRPSARIRPVLLIFVPLAVIYLLTIAFVPWFWFEDYYSSYGHYSYRHYDARDAYHVPFIAAEFSIIFFSILASATGAFVKERSKKTLDALILTPLDDLSIWLGKFFSICRRSLLFYAIPIVHIFLCMLHGIYVPQTLILMLINTVVLFAFFIVIGMSFSILFKRRASAMGMTLLVALIVFVLIPVFAAVADIGYRSGGEESENIVSISPWYWLGVPFFLRESYYHDGSYFDFGIGYAGYLILYAGATIVLFFIFGKTLRKRMKME